MLCRRGSVRAVLCVSLKKHVVQVFAVEWKKTSSGAVFFGPCCAFLSCLCSFVTSHKFPVWLTMTLLAASASTLLVVASSLAVLSRTASADTTSSRLMVHVSSTFRVSSDEKEFAKKENKRPLYESWWDKAIYSICVFVTLWPVGLILLQPHVFMHERPRVSDETNFSSRLQKRKRETAFFVRIIIITRQTRAICSMRVFVTLCSIGLLLLQLHPSVMLRGHASPRFTRLFFFNMDTFLAVAAHFRQKETHESFMPLH